MPFGKLIVALVPLVFVCKVQQVLAGPTTLPSAAPVMPSGWVTPSAASTGIILSDEDDNPEPTTTQASNAQSGRYFFGLLDSRSSYGKGFFPELYLGPEFDVETQVEVDYVHGEKRNTQDNEVDGEFDWNPGGELTVAGEIGWDSEHAVNPQGGDGDDVEQENAAGFEDADLAVYHPIFQYVSGDNVFDYTAVARLDVGIPTHTPASGNDMQLTPYIGQLLRIGEHVSVEGWAGSQFTLGPHQTNELIYGASVGYQIFHKQLPLPLTDELIPLFELDGQSPFSSHGQDALFGVAGVDWNLKATGPVQSTISIGYQFPIDQGARNEFDWGIIAQVFFDF